MASRHSSSTGSGERNYAHDASRSLSLRESVDHANEGRIALRQNWTVTLIPDNADDFECTFHSKNGAFNVGRTVVNPNPEAQAVTTERNNDYNTSCPVVSRTHARISWLANGDVVIVDSNSHHGTYINDSISRLTPGVSYKLTDQDTISFGKGIFKDGKFHQPHTVLVRLNVGDLTPLKSRTGTYGLGQQQRFTSVGSQSDYQAERIRSEVQRLGRRKDVAQKQKRQIQDVSSRLDYLEKKALERSKPQEVELRLKALERHYEGLLEKLTVIEQNLTRPQDHDDESDGEYERRKKRKRSAHHDEDDETDDDEPASTSTTKLSRPSIASTVTMVVVGGVAVWTALALS